MPWIPYYQAISKNLADYPKVGTQVLYKARGGKHPIWYSAIVERVINLRRYIIRYQVPEQYKCHFSNGTTSAIAKLDNLSFFCSAIDAYDDSPPKENSPEQIEQKHSDPKQSEPEK
jgi:hypothetical protein